MLVVSRVHRAFKENKALPELMERRAFKVYPEQTVHRAFREFRVRRENKAPRAMFPAHGLSVRSSCR